MNIGVFIIAVVVYGLIGQFLSNTALAILSTILVLSAMKVAQESGHDFLTTLGVK